MGEGAQGRRWSRGLDGDEGRAGGEGKSRRGVRRIPCDSLLLPKTALYQDQN